ncbi:hypothetical protein BH708_02510 [Brachybacterium sp. P6-10-X1]|uniref:hypothetical protein n=1 Tax=Brachybacterium sp. P6-10-X1 TaxID=1903186 RepID=UPI000971BACD|nr:hypothetical protein [Brachybacterium sp. P6-10-X1]APX31774.1 hypothetical protein BH708_02510 [Brachybacterium sp. P6-10-X1]
MNECPDDPYSIHFAGEKLEQEVSSALIDYRLTLAGAPPVDSTPWHRDTSMDRYSVRVRAGDDEITLSVDDWGDRLGEVRPFLREWIRQRVHLERAKLKSSSRRRDPYWTDQWRRAHPWGG